MVVMVDKIVPILLSAWMPHTRITDALITTQDKTGVSPEYDVCQTNLDVWMADHSHDNPSIVIATGFIARDPDGRATTLMRNGSDYSATIFGALLRVRRASFITVCAVPIKGFISTTLRFSCR